MFGVLIHFYVAEEHEEAFMETFDDSMERLEKRDGFIRFHVLTPADEDTDAHVALTFWENREDFTAWRNSESFAESHSGETPEGMFLGPPELDLYEVEVIHEA